MTRWSSVEDITYAPPQTNYVVEEGTATGGESISIQMDPVRLGEVPCPETVFEILAGLEEKAPETYFPEDDDL